MGRLCYNIKQGSDKMKQKKVIGIFILLLLLVGLVTFVLFREKDSFNKGHLTNLQAARTLEKIEINQLNTFANELYQELEGEENLFFSPLSIYMALGMTYNGAAEITKEEFENVFGKDVDLNDLNRELQYLVRGYEDIEFKLSNSLWIRDTYQKEVLESFLTKNKEYYGAKVSYLDFNKASAVDIINEWVAKTTEGLIEEAVEEIDPLTVMFLINTIYFQGDWLKQFEKEDTYETDFFITGDKVVDVDMMHQINNFDYYEDEDVQFVLLPYEGSETAMFVALPQNESSFDYNKLDKYIAKAKNNNTSVSLHLPKTEIGFRSSLKGALQSLGLKSAFDESLADFSNMAVSAKQDGLHIHDVIHEAVLIIDEEGTEAAAMTSVEMRVESVPQFDKKMKINRPFHVGIIDLDSSVILFSGHVNNPNE